ncbi:hypothetical protein [Actinomadura hibisca]|uniref:hypothetical protein n=1 Tax=Actinomadura hibisca TaxID=68565 RepID=UPI0008315F32|nr:hypothetical protein [Actinomadura hibisca]
MSKRKKNRQAAEQQVLEGMPVQGDAQDRASMPARIGGGVAGAVAGRVASKALRPAARKVARRYGIPAEPILRMVEVAAPVALSMVMAGMSKRKARKQAAHGAAPGPVEMTGRSGNLRHAHI